MTALSAHVSPAARARPESLGFSSARLARIDDFLKERYIAPGKLPCAHVLVRRRGESAHESVLGHANIWCSACPSRASADTA